MAFRLCWSFLQAHLFFVSCFDLTCTCDIDLTCSATAFCLPTLSFHQDEHHDMNVLFLVVNLQIAAGEVLGLAGVL